MVKLLFFHHVQIAEPVVKRKLITATTVSLSIGIGDLPNRASPLLIIANERTGETSYIEAAGADEFSAMNAAEGEVQEKGYEASFPSLITIDNVPTYIMVLKDKSGLVKLYACVNVNQYNIVATASTQEKCIDNLCEIIENREN